MLASGMRIDHVLRIAEAVDRFARQIGLPRVVPEAVRLEQDLVLAEVMEGYAFVAGRDGGGDRRQPLLDRRAAGGLVVDGNGMVRHVVVDALGVRAACRRVVEGHRLAVGIVERRPRPLA
jgi:hypothetical protein